jgi:septum formation protein
MVNGRIVLASRSPRRMEILRREGVAFESIEAPIDDPSTPPAGDAARVALELARRKAEAVVAAHPDRCRGAFVVAADTICRHGDASVGKAESPQEARVILARMMDGAHRVITAVAVFREGRWGDFVDEARVRLKHPGASEIDRFIEAGGWRGKAGAYDILERRAAGWVIHCEGDEDTVSGLPWSRLARLIEAWPS